MDPSIVEKIAKLSTEHFSANQKLTEAWILRQDGLSNREKLLTIQAANVEYAKAIHLALQSGLPKEIPFSSFLRCLADAEEQDEKKKGGEKAGLVAPAQGVPSA